MTRARLILNPSSGREHGGEQAELLTARLREKYDAVEIAVTTGDGDAERATILAVTDGCEALFVAGGDGTLNEVVTALAANGLLERIVIGIIPFGTGNDFAAALGIPVETEAALDLLLTAREIRTDLGRVNGRAFVNTSGGGFIAEASVAVTPQLKTFTGRLAYLIGGAQALAEHEPVHATVVLEPGHRRLQHSLHTFAVCNSRLIGGGRLIAPNAVIDDGLLDICLIQTMSALEFVALGTKVTDGEHIHDDRVLYLQASSVVMEFDRVVKVNTDGEVFEGRRCVYDVLPRAVRFLAGDAPFAGGKGDSSR